MAMSEKYIKSVVNFVSEFSLGIATAEIVKVFPRVSMKELENRELLKYHHKEEKWYHPDHYPQKLERTPEEREYVKNQEEAAKKKDDDWTKERMVEAFKHYLEICADGFYTHQSRGFTDPDEFSGIWNQVKLKVFSELAAEAEGDCYPVETTPTCPGSPGTGEMYHCHELDCPVHGKRNIEEASRKGK